MEDRFKFRVWDVDGNDFIADGYSSIVNDGDLYIFDDVDCSYSKSNSDNYIIEQCTGLKDKNGKLIFEGDVVSFEGGYEGDCLFPDQTLLVEWEEDGFCCDGRDVYWPRCEVIGNIHDNPELLITNNQ